MRILFITQYYPPDISAPANRISDWARALVKRGHEVWVITAFPHHHRHTIPLKYKGGWVVEEEKGDVKIIRVAIHNGPMKSLLHRLLNYISFTFTALLGLFKARGKFDICVISIPPPFVVFSLFLFKGFKCKEIAMDIRDLWPESMEAYLGWKGPLIWLLKKSIHLMYRISKKIIVATFGQEKYLRELGFSKVTTITNGWKYFKFPKEKLRKLKKKYYLSQKDKVAIYVGTIGYAFNFIPILKAIKNLSDWRLFIIGDGPLKEELISLSQKEKISNVYFLPSMPLKEMYTYLHIANVGILPKKKTKIFYQTLPSKLFDYLSAKLFVAGSISYSMKVFFKKTSFKGWKEVSSSQWRAFFKNFKKKRYTAHLKPFSLKSRINKLEKFLSR